MKTVLDFDLEGTAHRLVDRLLQDDTVEADQKAKIEYGLALTLGVAIELAITVGLSAFLGTARYTLLMMISALGLRIFTGGAHCLSYRRCLVFTMVIFIVLSVPVKAAALKTGYITILPVIAGLTLQALMASSVGKKLVLGSDRMMKRLGI